MSSPIDLMVSIPKRSLSASRFAASLILYSFTKVRKFFLKVSLITCYRYRLLCPVISAIRASEKLLLQNISGWVMTRIMDSVMAST